MTSFFKILFVLFTKPFTKKNNITITSSKFLKIRFIFAGLKLDLSNKDLKINANKIYK